jgi:hypothetical protein
MPESEPPLHEVPLPELWDRYWQDTYPEDLFLTEPPDEGLLQDRFWHEFCGWVEAHEPSRLNEAQAAMGRALQHYHALRHTSQN